MNKYVVIFEKTETGYSVYVPDLPGCVATGKTKTIAENNIYNAIRFHLEGLKLEHLSIPKRRSEAGILFVND
jgi:predicted RNase H-like HicB family nuclease